MKDEFRKAILKVAMGYSLEEVTEEYGVADGELKLLKRRETKKDVPPDLKAVKLLIEEKDYSCMTDEEFQKVKAEINKPLEFKMGKTMAIVDGLAALLIIICLLGGWLKSNVAFALGFVVLLFLKPVCALTWLSPCWAWHALSASTTELAD